MTTLAAVVPAVLDATIERGGFARAEPPVLPLIAPSLEPSTPPPRAFLVGV